MNPPSEGFVGLDGGFQRGDRRGEVARPLIEVRHHAEAHRRHDRAIETSEPVGGRPVVALGLDEVSVEHRQLGERVRPGGDRERIVGHSPVQVAQRQPAPTRLVELTQHGGLLGVERVGQREPATSPWRSKISIAVARSSSLCSGGPTRKSISPRPVSASARVRSSASPSHENASSSQRLPSWIVPREPVRPAGAAGDRQRGLGVVVGDGPVERGPRGCRAPGRSPSATPAGRRRCRRPRSRRRARRSASPSRHGCARRRRVR